MGFYQVIDHAKLNEMLRGPNGAVARDMLRRGLKVEGQAKKNLRSDPTRVKTGRLSSSITHEMRFGGARLVMRVGTNVSYARFVHDGTGLYGPRGQLIRPKSKKALRWVGGKGRRGYTFSKWSRGMRPNHYLKNALRAARG